jgi:hypothetical protein
MNVSSPNAREIDETKELAAAGGRRGTHFAPDRRGRRRLFRSCDVRYWLPRFCGTRRPR